MRLWHEALLTKLPRMQLLGQHRECCALRGKGWGRPHSTVNYVFTHSPNFLVAYHIRVMKEMERRGYHPAEIWSNPYWRGNTLQEQTIDWVEPAKIFLLLEQENYIYPEHNKEYLQECIENLSEKGIKI